VRTVHEQMLTLHTHSVFLSYIAMLTVRISGLRMSAALRLAYLRALFMQPVSVIDTISPGKVLIKEVELRFSY
jgi:ATP-binding cassette subfamily B (MDR/TAP) protein 1